jgi:predicted aldo/keto reductase-like oxidoreductase
MKNLSDKRRRFKVDLSALGAGTMRYRLKSKSKGTGVETPTTVELSAQEEASWVPVR